MADGAQIVVVEIDDAREIAGISHVHRVGERVAGGARNQFAAAEKFGNNVVGIGRGDKLRDGQADTLGKQASRQVAEVAAGNRKHDRSFRSTKLRDRGEIIKNLRESAARY